MSIHPSLSAAKKGKKQKSVLKRIERMRIMLEKGLWKEGDSVFGLPKIKTIKIKIKKEKVEKAAEAVATEGAAPAAGAGAEAKKEQTTAKAPAGKADKK